MIAVQGTRRASIRLDSGRGGMLRDLRRFRRSGSGVENSVCIQTVSVHEREKGKYLEDSLQYDAQAEGKKMRAGPR